MLDIKRIRTSFEEVESLVKLKGPYSVLRAKEADEEKRRLLQRVEEMRARQNAASKEIAQLKKDGQSDLAINEEMKLIASEIKTLKPEIDRLEDEISNILLATPNTPNPNCPVGASEKDNPVVREWGEPTVFNFEILPHWEIGANLNILDFERAAKMAGARFSIWKGQGAKLERALIALMLSLHTENEGYTEIIPPLMVNRKALTATGQLPKFEEDAFNVKNNDYFLIPTAEVPLTNMYSGEILSYADLPIKLTAYTPCFRAEAGSAGRDTRGLIRNHQFDKVELVKFSDQETSYEELEKMTIDAENVLRALNLPYRTIELCTGDLGFSSAKTYDIEVWMPSYNRYVEISSCSNMEDYQARRANIRYRDEEGRLHFAHTLNGSALAVGRAFAAILENFQTEEGGVMIPEALWPYMGGQKSIGVD